MRKLLKRALVVLATGTVALSMLEAPASAAAPKLSATPPGSASATASSSSVVGQKRRQDAIETSWSIATQL